MPVVIWEFLRQNLTKIKFGKNFCLDILFPKFCFSCSKEGNWLCDSCLEKIVFVKTQVCSTCGRISETGKFCQPCLRLLPERRNLSGIISTCYFEEGPIRELVHNFKYNHILELGDFFGQIMASVLRENLILEKDTIIAPVPLHFLRQSQRGYNQAEILAQVVAEKLSLPFEKVLKRTHRTKRQVDLTGNARRENLKSVFEVCSGKNISGKIIILVDDITTTGTTLTECAKVLKGKGAKKVWGLVIARG
ncbi:MAG: Phosphoribosyltransferase [Berkelbacteria bacterium GW2011_GWA1_36_9]|uniref:Phosphoribosyltransferase n=1 Tax=Berkelbacteria bacterium GW2011_GWA1_36_9 TaxID=1618331 RepID=A0A0G0FTS3_9BACT|nr:MAG: Phosphoribosyltransferase [Berkelbacteria bacterium GW2011_GWA1_36_9]